MKINELLREEETPVGSFKDGNYKVFVYSEPRGNPSFHFRNRTGDTEEVFQIKDFKLLEKKTKKEFSSKEIKILKEWLTEQTINPDFKDKTNWDVLLILWNVCNPQFRVNSSLKII